MSTQNNLNGETWEQTHVPPPYANSQQPELLWPNPGKLPCQSYCFYDIREVQHRTCQQAATMADTDSVINEDGVVNPCVCAAKKKESFKHHSAVRQGCQVSRFCRVTQAFSACLTLSLHGYSWREAWGSKSCACDWVRACRMNKNFTQAGTQCWQLWAR